MIIGLTAYSLHLENAFRITKSVYLFQTDIQYTYFKTFIYWFFKCTTHCTSCRAGWQYGNTWLEFQDPVIVAEVARVARVPNPYMTRNQIITSAVQFVWCSMSNEPQRLTFAINDHRFFACAVCRFVHSALDTRTLHLTRNPVQPFWQIRAMQRSTITLKCPDWLPVSYRSQWSFCLFSFLFLKKTISSSFGYRNCAIERMHLYFG
jgi:hypothetical protein